MNDETKTDLIEGTERALAELAAGGTPADVPDRVEFLTTRLQRLLDDLLNPEKNVHINDATAVLLWAMKEAAEIGDLPSMASNKGLFDATWILASTWRVAEHAER